MGYQVINLDRPEGTYATDPGWMGNLSAASQALKDWLDKQEKKKRDAAIREAIKNEQLTPKYEYDSKTGEWKERWEKSKETDTIKEFKKKIQQQIMLGQTISRSDAEAYDRLQRLEGKFGGKVPKELIEQSIGEGGLGGGDVSNVDTSYKPSEVTKWAGVPLHRRILSALTPSETPEESQLGPLRIGGIFKPPATEFAEPQPKVKLPGLAGPELPQQDPRIVQRIDEARKQGWKDEDIANDLREKGIDPSLYGL